MNCTTIIGQGTASGLARTKSGKSPLPWIPRGGPKNVFLRDRDVPTPRFVNDGFILPPRDCQKLCQVGLGTIRRICHMRTDYIIIQKCSWGAVWICGSLKWHSQNFNLHGFVFSFLALRKANLHDVVQSLWMITPRLLTWLYILELKYSLSSCCCEAFSIVCFCGGRMW